MSEEQSPFEKNVVSRSRDAEARAALMRERFYELVIKAIDELPEEFQDKLENLDIVIADWPSPLQLAKANIRSRFGILGLYEGVPHTRRDRGYDMVLPDKITIFRKPIEAHCHTWGEIEEEVKGVVRHEIAHHFGTDEKRLRIIESKRRRKK